LGNDPIAYFSFNWRMQPDAKTIGIQFIYSQVLRVNQIVFIYVNKQRSIFYAVNELNNKNVNFRSARNLKRRSHLTYRAF
jgi:hypothetical protein